MLNEVRWCHAGQVTLCAEPSCHWAEAVPQDCQSVIIILMTCIALLAMSSLVCAKANEQRPNCKINWKTFWLKNTLTTLSFLHFLLVFHWPRFFPAGFSFRRFYFTNILLISLFPSYATYCFYDLLLIFFFRQITTFSCAQPPCSCFPPLFFVFSHQTPSCAAVSCIFSSRLHYCLFFQLHCVCFPICMQWGTYNRTCSFLFTALPTPIILNFFRVVSHCLSLHISKALEPQWKEGSRLVSVHLLPPFSSAALTLVNIEYWVCAYTHFLCTFCTHIIIAMCLKTFILFVCKRLTESS